MEDDKPKSLVESMGEMKETINEMNKHFNAPKRSFLDKLTGKNRVGKEYQLPRKIRVLGNKKIKQNYVLLFFVRTNGNVEIEFAPISNDLVYVRQTGIYHAANAKYVMRYQKYPVMIVLEWSLLPLNSEEEHKKSKVLDLEEHYKQAEQSGEISYPEKVVIAATKAAQMGTPTMMQGKTILWIILGAIVALYLLSTILGGG